MHSLEQIRRDAKKKKMRVTTLADTEFMLGGTNVYVHPPDVKITKEYLRANVDAHDKYFVAWFMAIGKMCECD